MRKISIILFVAAIAIMTSSCVTELQYLDSFPQDVDLSFSPSIVSMDRNTKSDDAGSTSGIVSPFKIMDESSSKSLTLSYSNRPFSDPVDAFAQADYQTKGDLMNVSGEVTSLQNFGINDFKVQSWNIAATPATAYIDAYKTVSYIDNKWSIEGDDTYKVTSKDNFVFYAYANSPSSGFEPQECTSENQKFRYVVPVSPESQNDILLGYYTGNTASSGQTKPTGEVSLKFGHPLTSVVFKLGEDVSIDYIKSISISGVYSSGTVTHTSYQNFEWVGSGTKEVSQNNLQEDDIDEENGYIGSPFVVIPQDLSERPVTFKIVASIDETEVTLVASRAVENWKAGECNVYTIQEDPGYTVDILGDLSSGVYFKNTSGTSLYIRVAVVGNKFDAQNRIVAPWNGSFTLGSNWNKSSSDNFYYYSSLLEPDSESYPILFLPSQSLEEGVKVEILVQVSHYPF